MISPSRGDWSLQRKGPVDQARHMEKIREAIKENLPKFSDMALMTSWSYAMSHGPSGRFRAVKTDP